MDASFEAFTMIVGRTVWTLDTVHECDGQTDRQTDGQTHKDHNHKDHKDRATHRRTVMTQFAIFIT